MNNVFSKRVTRSFDRASSSYLPAARLQQQVARDALQYLPLSQHKLIDLGCGPGWLHPELAGRCQQLVAVDLSDGMLQQAALQQYAVQYIKADAASLPFTAHYADSLFSSLMLQWCAEPAQVLHEVSRVLKPGGTAVITTLLKGTLAELESAFAALDDKPHIHHFLAAEQLMAAAEQPDMQWQFYIKPYTLYYPDVFGLLQELKALGANQLSGRRQGLTGKSYWQKLAAEYEQFRCASGVPAQYQVMFLYGSKKEN
ncbi:malonyl-ACP O-methyltransferase BioC [Chromatiaceae bacterium AAb-1]|nr:malonyl-ACP O-methyltransferase BioC [Chromatiaceae bacterium AAb-1]